MQSASDTAPAYGEAWCTHHPITPQDRIAMDQMRSLTAPFKGKLRGVAARAQFDAMMSRAVVAPAGVTFRQASVGGIAGWWCEPSEVASDAVILHAHGGWFTWGSAEVFRNFIGHIALSTRATAFVPDYRLAPEHPFPAAIDDLHACYLGLIESGVKSIAVTGDSAGGNLALLLLARISTLSPADRRVVASVVLSPVTDLALKGPSWDSRANADPYFLRDQVEELIQAYLGNRNPTDATASPLYGNLAGLPPVRAHVGDDEVLLDDSRRYVARAVAAGVDARLDVWEGMPHGFVGSVGQMEAASEALAAIGAFLSQHIAAAPNA